MKDQNQPDTEWDDGDTDSDEISPILHECPTADQGFRGFRDGFPGFRVSGVSGTVTKMQKVRESTRPSCQLLQFSVAAEPDRSARYHDRLFLRCGGAHDKVEL
jgi:hypothetical protein